MKKLLRLGVVLGALLGVLGMNMTPASATTTASIAFTGKATTSPLFYPCFPAGTTDCLSDPLGPDFAFAFASATCVGSKTDVAKSKSTTSGLPVGEYLCESITAAGTGTGYCGLSTATGTASIRWTSPNSTPQSKSTDVQFSYVGVGGELVITGTGEKTPEGPEGRLAGVVTAVPQPTPPILGQGCSATGATGFTIVGTATYEEVTVPVG